MQFFKSYQGVYAFLIFMLLSSYTYGQSNIEYGIGVGVLYGDYHESDNLPEGFEFDIDEARVSPSINTYLGYRYSENTKITFSPGINFHVHYEPFSTRKLSTVYVHFPLGIQRKITGNLSILGDLFYDYLVNQSYEFRREHASITELADTRNLFGATAGLAFSIGRYAELQLTASHQFNTVNSFELSDLNGEKLGDVKLKNRYLKLNLVFRG